MLHGTWSICLVEIALWILIYGISKIALWILAYAWIEKLDFISDISDIRRPRNEIQHQLSKRRNIGKISTIYRFGTDKSAKKSSVKRCAEQRRKPVKISKIYRRYIGKISEIFLKVFF